MRICSPLSHPLGASPAPHLRCHALRTCSVKLPRPEGASLTPNLPDQPRSVVAGLCQETGLPPNEQRSQGPFLTGHSFSATSFPITVWLAYNSLAEKDGGVSRPVWHCRDRSHIVECLRKWRNGPCFSCCSSHRSPTCPCLLLASSLWLSHPGCLGMPWFSRDPVPQGLRVSHIVF